MFICLFLSLEQPQAAGHGFEDAPVLHRLDADGHEGAVPRGVRFSDCPVGNLSLDQRLLEFLDVGLVAGSKNDRNCAFRQVSGAALARSVNELRTENTKREVLPDDTVVSEMARSRGFEPLTFRLLTPAALPLSVRTLVVGQEPSEGLGDRPPGSLAVPLSPGGASEAVKLA
jgi:hypothetical protein